jgi:hypothetical protein
VSDEPILSVHVHFRGGNTGRIDAGRLELPATIDAFREFLERAGVAEIKDGNYRLSEYRSQCPEVSEFLGAHESFDELNMLASLMGDLSPTESVKLRAILQSGLHAPEEGAGNVINLLYESNFEDAFIVCEVFNDDELGKYVLNAEHDDSYDRVDFAAYGERVRVNNGGVFTDFGYVSGGDDDVVDIYTGIVPKEYLITHTPAPRREREGIKTQAINGDISIGDFVAVVPYTEYGGYIGTVIYIEKLGTSEHDTDNPTDDVHINIIGAGYSERQLRELAQSLGYGYAEDTPYGNLPIDDIIMSPDELVRITELDPDAYKKLVSSVAETGVYCEQVLTDIQNQKTAELVGRVDENFANYNKSLLSFGKAELIEMAGKISATSDAHSFMTVYHGFDDEELAFYLQFQNPLEIVADAWRERTIDLSDMTFAMNDIFGRRGELQDMYPLMSETAVSTDGKTPNITDTDHRVKSESKYADTDPASKRSMSERIAEATEKVNAQEPKPEPVNKNEKEYE